MMNIAAELRLLMLQKTFVPSKRDGSYYAVAGSAAEGIVGRMTEDMAEQFPGVTLPDFNVIPESLLAYAYLKAEIAFKTPYFDQQGTFTDATGNKTEVGGFGLFEGSNEVNEELAEQVEVLYTSRKDGESSWMELEYYALDLCRFSKPCQVIVAQVPWRDNLQHVVNDLLARIERWEVRDIERKFHSTDQIFVPNVNYNLTHEFRELIGPGKAILNPGFEGYFIAAAFQRIKFKLDKSGALLVSDAAICVDKACPREFLFDRPFLVMLRKRGAASPFFVMWVDNAELLCRTEK